MLQGCIEINYLPPFLIFVFSPNKIYCMVVRVAGEIFFSVFFCNFVSFKSIGEKYSYFLSIGEKICNFPLFSSPLNNFFPQHVILPFQTEKQKNIHNVVQIQYSYRSFKEAREATFFFNFDLFLVCFPRLCFVILEEPESPRVLKTILGAYKLKVGLFSQSH